MTERLNQFTGCSDRTLKIRLKNMLADLKELREDDEELGGGDPLEGIYERIADLESEIKRRAALSAPSTDAKGRG